jgi:hypothetical protein
LYILSQNKAWLEYIPNNVTGYKKGWVFLSRRSVYDVERFAQQRLVSVSATATSSPTRRSKVATPQKYLHAILLPIKQKTKEK